MVSTLYRIVADVAHAQSIEEALQVVVTRIGDVVPSDAVSIFLVDTNTNKLILKASSINDFGTIGVSSYPLGRGLVGLAWERAEPIALSEMKMHPRYFLNPEVNDSSFNAFLACPIIGNRKVVGAVCVYRSKSYEFSEDEITFVFTLAAQIAYVALIEVVGNNSEERGLVGKRDKTVFLSYAREDYDSVKSVYDELRNHGWSLWMDKENLIGGQKWKWAIEKAIQGSDFFLAFLSSVSVSKRGYFQKELRTGIDVLDQIPDDQIFVIPVRLDICEIPHRFRNIHCIDLFADNGLQRVLKALEFSGGIKP